MTLQDAISVYSGSAYVLLMRPRCRPLYRETLGMRRSPREGIHEFSTECRGTQRGDRQSGRTMLLETADVGPDSWRRGGRGSSPGGEPGQARDRPDAERGGQVGGEQQLRGPGFAAWLDGNDATRPRLWTEFEPALRRPTDRS